MRIRWSSLALATLLVMACQLPLSTQTKVVNLSLTVTAPNASRDLGRLLLPTVKTVNITATPATGAAVTASQALVGTQATVTLKLLPFVAYQLLAEGADASGKVLFSGSQTYTATAAASVTLNLLPQAASGSSWPTVAASSQPSGGSSVPATADQTVKAGQSSTFVLDFTGGGSTFAAATVPTGLSLYLQDSTGAALTGTTVSAASLGGSSTFLATYYNGTGADISLTNLGTFTIPVASVTPSQTTYSAPANGTVTLGFSVSPANATNPAATDFTWTVTGATGISVSNAGVVTASSNPGDTGTVTATSILNPAVKATFSVQVLAVSGASFTFPSYTGLVFSSGSATTTFGTAFPIGADTTNTGAAALVAGGTNWQVQVDNGTPVALTYATLAVPGTVPVGIHTVTVLVTYQNTDYSGSFTLTVNQ